VTGKTWRYRHTVLALAVVANFTQLGSRLLISPLVPEIIRTFRVSKGAVGLALTGMWASYALFQYPSGVLGDVYGERRIVLAALAMTGLGSLLLAFSPSFALFGLFALFLGAGTGLYFSVATSLLTDLFDETGGPLSLHTAGGAFAGLVAPAAAGFVGVRYGWRAGVLLGLFAAIPVFGLAAWRLRRTPPAGSGSLRGRLVPIGLAGVLARPDVAFTTAVAVVAVFAFQAFSSFFPTFLVEYRGLGAGIAGVVFGAVFLLSAISQPVMGRLSDAFSRDAALVASFLLTVAGLTVVLSVPSTVGLAAAVGLLGTGISWAGVIHARFMDRLSDDARGTAFGFLRTVYMFVGASGSVVTGALADGVGWVVALGVPGGLLAVGALALLSNRALGLNL
jgi:MFS family permease